ncbi:hypothetical protein BU197_09955 [Streptomyces sp. CBMA291]|nr:hypothetical protein [Streptomyces sp. CBMA291]MBD0714571.1 hypothetical protein [Streptomyces sp. CBMA370]
MRRAPGADTPGHGAPARPAAARSRRPLAPALAPVPPAPGTDPLPLHRTVGPRRAPPRRVRPRRVRTSHPSPRRLPLRRSADAPPRRETGPPRPPRPPRPASGPLH